MRKLWTFAVSFSSCVFLLPKAPRFSLGELLLSRSQACDLRSLTTPAAAGVQSAKTGKPESHAKPWANHWASEWLGRFWHFHEILLSSMYVCIYVCMHSFIHFTEPFLKMRYSTMLAWKDVHHIYCWMKQASFWVMCITGPHFFFSK